MTSRREWHAQAVPARVLIVDDEPSITDAVATALRYEGFETTRGRDRPGGDARRPRSSRPDLVILDIMLPDLDGLSIARKLRALPDGVPVIFLSARDATQDKIAGLSLADDYVAKPFSLGELVARVHAVLRRTRGDAGNVLRFADVELDEDTYEVSRAGERIELTPTEFSLLRFLLANPRRVLSKRQILDHVWQYDFGGDANIVETYVSYLRRKLDRARPAADPHRAARRLRAAGGLMRLSSLRTRLVAITMVLAAVGLIIASVATYAALRSFLLDRVDRTLEASSANVGRALTRGGPGRGPGGSGALGQAGQLTPGLYVEVRDPNGRQAVRPDARAAGRAGPRTRSCRRSIDASDGTLRETVERGRRRVGLPRARRGAALRPRRR